MRQNLIDAISKFEPYSGLYENGADPDSVKEAILQLLRPYVFDFERLKSCATSYLAGETIAIGRLLARVESKALFEHCLKVREAAVGVNSRGAFSVIAGFEQLIQDAKKNYALLVMFEVPKDELPLEEFAFELIRTIGTLAESNLQPYIKELLCLEWITQGKVVDLSYVSSLDFGKACQELEKCEGYDELLSPFPWRIRLNQWRNIAQHCSFTCGKEAIVLTYGKCSPPKQAFLTREDLLIVARELVTRVGAMKSARAITHLNHSEGLGPFLPDIKPSAYNVVIALGASFAAQGFRLKRLEASETKVWAEFEDLAPSDDLVRPVHCSQFIATLADQFPRRSVQVCYFGKGLHSWTFTASEKDLTVVMAEKDPLKHLAQVVQFKREI